MDNSNPLPSFTFFILTTTTTSPLSSLRIPIPTTTTKNALSATTLKIPTPFLIIPKPEPLNEYSATTTQTQPAPPPPIITTTLNKTNPSSQMGPTNYPTSYATKPNPYPHPQLPHPPPTKTTAVEINKLIKTPCGIRIVLGENNDGEPRLFDGRKERGGDVVPFGKLLIVDEGIDIIAAEGVIEGGGEEVVRVFAPEAEEHIVGVPVGVGCGGV